jgi:hypothetical protein
LWSPAPPRASGRRSALQLDNKTIAKSCAHADVWQGLLKFWQTQVWAQIPHLLASALQYLLLQHKPFTSDTKGFHIAHFNSVNNAHM